MSASINVYTILFIIIGCNLVDFTETSSSVPVVANAMRSNWRIVGGRNCSIKNYSFMVSLRTLFPDSGRFQHICGGSLIKEKWVLTAALCIVDLEEDQVVRLVIGYSFSTDTDLWIESKTFFLTYAQDIALVKLKKPASTLGVQYSFIKLPTKVLENDLSKYCEKTKFEVVGWGYEKPVGENELKERKDLHPSKDLKCAMVPYMTNKECSALINETLDDDEICTMTNKTEGGCQGDSGGPLFCNGVQYGIISIGYACGMPNSPTFYTRVDRYLDFISESIKNSKESYYVSLLSVLIALILLLYQFSCEL